MTTPIATIQWSQDDIDARRRALLAWYDAHARDLPWRRRPSLYGTWVSEIMLQQTTVTTVTPRWPDFLARFPDVQALAAAPEAEVLAMWSGLGYYRRARNLHAAARAIVAAGGGLPRTLAGWRALPGIGDYAAGAIASIGLGLAHAAVDANVRRVLTRWACRSGPEAATLGPRDLQRLAQQHLDVQRPGDWNQALMDLGAEVCRSDQPRCPGCPVASWCAAALAAATDEVPPAAPGAGPWPCPWASWWRRAATRSCSCRLPRPPSPGRAAQADRCGATWAHFSAGRTACP